MPTYIEDQPQSSKLKPPITVSTRIKRGPISNEF